MVARQAHNLEVAGSNPATKVPVKAARTPDTCGRGQDPDPCRLQAHPRQIARPTSAGIAALPAEQERPPFRAGAQEALGNAEDRGAGNIDDLIVDESRIDGGPIMKRIRPRPRHGVPDQAALRPYPHDAVGRRRLVGRGS